MDTSINSSSRNKQLLPHHCAGLFMPHLTTRWLTQLSWLKLWSPGGSTQCCLMNNHEGDDCSMQPVGFANWMHPREYSPLQALQQTHSSCRCFCILVLLSIKIVTVNWKTYFTVVGSEYIVDRSWPWMAFIHSYNIMVSNVTSYCLYQIN